MAGPNPERSLGRERIDMPEPSGREERLLTAAVMLVVSLAFNAGGLLLFLTGGIGVLFGSALCLFGVTGCFQSIMTAIGRGQPSERGRER
jgi:hypothetical protein